MAYKKFGRNRITPESYEQLKDYNQFDFDFGITQEIKDEAWEKLSVYERKEIQILAGDEIPEYLMEIQERKDAEVIEKIVRNRLLEHQTKKFIGLEAYYRIKREYSDTFISLMAKQPMELRLKLLNCFECLKKWYRTKENLGCNYEKLAKKYHKGTVVNQYEQILTEECPICVQNHLLTNKGEDFPAVSA